MRLATIFEISVVLVLPFFSLHSLKLLSTVVAWQMDERVLTIRHAKLCRKPNMTATKTK